jgi:hypothetical protein
MSSLFESRGLVDLDPEYKRYVSKSAADYFLGFSDTEDKSNKLVQSAGNYLRADVTQIPVRLEPSSTTI